VPGLKHASEKVGRFGPTYDPANAWGGHELTLGDSLRVGLGSSPARDPLFFSNDMMQ
jgi:hypothetical protein